MKYEYTENYADKKTEEPEIDTTETPVHLDWKYELVFNLLPEKEKEVIIGVSDGNLHEMIETFFSLYQNGRSCSTAARLIVEHPHRDYFGGLRRRIDFF